MIKKPTWRERAMMQLEERVEQLREQADNLWYEMERLAVSLLLELPRCRTEGYTVTGTFKHDGAPPSRIDIVRVRLESLDRDPRIMCDIVHVGGVEDTIPFDDLGTDDKRHVIDELWDAAKDANGEPDLMGDKA